MTTSKKKAKKQYDINVKTIVAVKQTMKNKQQTSSAIKQRTPITFYVLWAFIALVLFLLVFKIIVPLIKLLFSYSVISIIAMLAMAYFMYSTVLRNN